VRLLVVEDEVGLVEALRKGLKRDGYAVDTATSASSAAGKLATTAYDAMILDLTLPDADGVALCRDIRQGRRGAASGTELRMLMLTARSDLVDRVRGLDSGADDYLTKPFAFAELRARLRALLRRDVAGASAVMSVGEIRLDRAGHRITRHGKELVLTMKEFGVLEYLMVSAGRVVSAEELLEHVWDEHADPFTETVRVTVGTLRRKLASTGEPSPIETVIRKGYRLRAEP
jgi:DNA-binding response OmpR family regulator